MELKYLNDKLQEYRNKGFGQQVEWATKRARGETREWIEKHHPPTAFGGKSLTVDNYNNKTHHQTVLGSYNAYSTMVVSTIFSNYFQRWFETGAKQHTIDYGVHKGWLSTHYPARGDFYATNQSAIEQYYAERLDEALKFFIKIE